MCRLEPAANKRSECHLIFLCSLVVLAAGREQEESFKNHNVADLMAHYQTAWEGNGEQAEEYETTVR